MLQASKGGGKQTKEWRVEGGNLMVGTPVQKLDLHVKP